MALAEHAQYETSGESFNPLPCTHRGAEGLVARDCAGSSHASKLFLQQEKDRLLDCFLFSLEQSPGVG